MPLLTTNSIRTNYSVIIIHLYPCIRHYSYGEPPQQWSDDSNNTLPNPANLTPPMQASLLYATRCKVGRGKCLHHEKCHISVGEQSCKMLLLRMRSYFKTVFSFNVCLKGPHEQLIQAIVCKYGEFEDSDVTTMTSSSVTSPVDAP